MYHFGYYSGYIRQDNLTYDIQCFSVRTLLLHLALSRKYCRGYAPLKWRRVIDCPNNLSTTHTSLFRNGLHEGNFFLLISRRTEKWSLSVIDGGNMSVATGKLNNCVSYERKKEGLVHQDLAQKWNWFISGEPPLCPPRPKKAARTRGQPAA